MRNILVLISIIFVSSCGTDDTAYPKSYNFEKSEITESFIYTIDNNGNEIFPSQISTFTQTGVSAVEFFEQLSPDFPISKITILSETTGTIEFNQNVLQQGPTDFTYSENQESLIPQFGVFLEGDVVYGQACLSVNAQTQPYLPEFSINFCDGNNAIEACKNLFNERMYGVGDTLGFALQSFIFVQE